MVRTFSSYKGRNTIKHTNYIFTHITYLYLQESNKNSSIKDILYIKWMNFDEEATGTLRIITSLAGDQALGEQKCKTRLT